MKILIVDGSKDRRRELTAALADLNNVVIQGAVADVRSAVSAVSEASPDLVVTDATLPDGDGTYLLERIRSLSRTPSVIVLASRINDDQRTHYLCAGADSYLDGNDLASVRAAVLGLAASKFAVGSIPPQDSQRLLGRMTAGVVHDFNNYLHAADISLQLLQRGSTEPDLMATARSAIETMQRMTATLLAYARGGVPSTGTVDVGVVVTETIALARRLIPSSVSVSLEIGDGLRPIHGVRSELEQVVLNLLVNACDAMPDGGRLEVRVRQCTSQALMLEVSDDGSGFSPDGARSSKPGRAGAALGLTIVRSVVARQGGALRIVARTRGTTLAIMLPTSAKRAA